MELIKILSEILSTNKIAIEVLGIFIVLDIVSGLIKAVIEKDLQSGKMRTGLLKKIMEILLVIVSALLDALMHTTYIATAVVAFTVGMEGLSILENIGTYIPLPSVLKSVLENLKAQGEEE